jgi:hypothetical protein
MIGLAEELLHFWVLEGCHDGNLLAGTCPVIVKPRMATAPSEPLSQRLAAIREQLKLLADYL